MLRIGLLHLAVKQRIYSPTSNDNCVGPCSSNIDLSCRHSGVVKSCRLIFRSGQSVPLSAPVPLSRSESQRAAANQLCRSLFADAFKLNKSVIRSLARGGNAPTSRGCRARRTPSNHRRPRCSHDAVDDKVVIGVFVEQQVLVTVSRWKDSEYSRIVGSLINASSKTLVRFTQVCDLLQAKGYQTIESETAERD